jgi:DNA repair photolyase
MTGVMIDPVTGEIIDQKEPAERLLTQAKEQGVSQVGPGGLLNQFTRNVLETALEAELLPRAPRCGFCSALLLT